MGRDGSDAGDAGKRGGGILFSMVGICGGYKVSWVYGGWVEGLWWVYVYMSIWVYGARGGLYRRDAQWRAPATR